MQNHAEKIGATYLGDNACRFRVWAPALAAVGVRFVGSDRLIALEPSGRGYHDAIVEDVVPGALYFFQLGRDQQRPDPASRFQPRGVHGPSAVVDPQFSWEDAGWSAPALDEYVIYELHVGAFTPAGTFEAIIPYLDYLAEVGVTALELMPVAQFPGERNWGYDGAYPFAAQNSYGGPDGLKKLINACHRRGLAVALDVVYNHLGPEGNYFREFAPYFTERYQTPWGAAINFDGPDSDEVRQFFIQNALYWFDDFHIDALRLDAVHAILDHSPFTFLEALSLEVEREAKRLDRRMFLIAESADNNARLLRPRERCGYELDGQWNDDFHHSLRTLLTGERRGYYQDYGDFSQLVKAYREGFVYSGEYSRFRRRRHGISSRDVPARKLVVFAQNHDQVGNRMRGDRLTQAGSFEQLKLAAGLVILAPFLPLLFMGEEYGETAPFPYFVSHSDPELIEAVRRGRRMEFAEFDWQGDVPDPQDEATFLSAKLDHELRHQGEHKVLLDFYRELIRLRKTIAALARGDKDGMEVTGHSVEKILAVERWHGQDRALLLANLAGAERSVETPFAGGRWRKALDSAAPKWRGLGSALPDALEGGQPCRLTLGASTIALFRRENGA
ncbi:MAG TPA: malto-oligosyltrehalose trehalohydrolase [Candidatus Binatia bacterium]